MIKKTNLSDYNPNEVPNGAPYKIGILVAEWNADITNRLMEGAITTLQEHGVPPQHILVEHVPGSYELSTGADLMLSHTDVDAVIAIGCVIQGDTRHFDFICEAVSQGLTNVSLHHHKPVIFTLLTTNNVQQALDRCGGTHGNKGVEGAITALKMCRLAKKLEERS